MTWNPFIGGAKSFLGIDIGTSAIKIVELSRWGNRKKLENYGEMRSSALYEKPFRTFEKNTLTVSGDDVVKVISAIVKESKMKAVKAYFSIPDFSTFFTNFQLPSMTEEEVPQAIQYEARQYIPVPLGEVTLDWQIVGKKTTDKEKTSDFKILLAAVPNEVIAQYQNLARASGLELLALEAEVFGLARAVANRSDTFVAIDLGARSTTISIIDGRILKISHSFDTSGDDLTNLITQGLNMDFQKAEELKIKEGILDQASGSAREAILPTVDLIVSEVRKILQNYYRTENKESKEIILAGGSAWLPGLADYFSKELSMPVKISNPFANIYYPPVLEETLKQIGPAYAVAVGEAMRGLE